MTSDARIASLIFIVFSSRASDPAGRVLMDRGQDRLGPRPRQGQSRREAASIGRSAVAVPLLQVRQRVDRATALVPAGCRPNLEVEVTGSRVAGLADDADRLA